MPTLDEMLAKSGELTQAQKRAARLRATQQQFTAMGDTPIRSGVTRTQNGGLYETVGSYVPDYGGYARQIAGALGSYYTGKKADEAEVQSDTARNQEILRTVEAIGQQRRAAPGGASSDSGVTEQALRGYLSVLGGPDVQDILGKQAHVSGQRVDANGDVWHLMSNGEWVNSGLKSDYNVEKIIDPLTGNVSVIGKSGAGRGVVQDARYGAPPNTPAPAAAPGGVMAPDMGGPKPVIDVPEVDPNVQAMLANGVAFMESIGLPKEQQDAWVAEQIGKARTAKNYAQAAGTAPAAAPAGIPAPQGGAPLRIGGAADVAAAKTNAEIAAQAQNAGALAGIEGAKVEARQTAERKVDLQQQLPKLKAQSESMSNAIQRLKTAKGLDSIVGGSIMGAIPNEGQISTVARGVQSILNPDGADAMAAYDNVVGKVYQQAFETLRGGGQITEKETERTANAYARLQRAQSKSEFLAALDELDSAIKAGYARMEQAGAQLGAAAPAAAPTKPALPAGFEWGD